MSRQSPERAGPVSEIITRRLSLYLRGLQKLEAAGVKTISSQTFGERFGFSSAQIRKDLTLFGEFGIRGVGYDVENLKEHVMALLGIDRENLVILFGAGNLGQALAGYEGFNSGGFRIAALFDIDPEKIGTRLRNGIPILDRAAVPDFVRTTPVDIAVLAVPPEAAQKTAELAVSTGIRAILNFVPVQLQVPESVFVRNVELKISLETLSFYLKNS
jgi:redox-sensing transcriptional repressor